MAVVKKIASPNRVFLFFSLASIFFGFMWIMITKGEAWNTVLFYNWNDHYMDFFNHIRYVDSPENVYNVSMHACFPAFAYLIYYAMNRMIPADYMGDGFSIRTSPYGNMIFLMYMLIVTLMFIWTAKKYLKIKEAEQFMYIVALLFTVPFLYLFERGNIVYLVVVLLIMFLMLYESDSPVKRELAIICLAFAAGLKLYPAIFGVLYIKDRRFKEAARAVIYGILVFVLPFAFFGGFDGFKQFMTNITQVNEVVWPEGCFNSLVHTVILIGYKLGIATETSIAVGKVLSVVYAIVLLVAAFFQKSKWKTYALLSGIMIWFPMWSGSYTITYMAIPLLAFASESESTEKRKGIDYVYAVLFAGIFSLIVINSKWCLELCGYHLTVALRYVAMVAIFVLIVGEQTAELVRYLYNKSNHRFK